MTRQVRRQIERAEAKKSLSASKAQSRIAARRSRLVRQSGREKSGYYEGRRAVAVAVAPSRSRITTRTVSKGKAFGRHIRKTTVNGTEFALHATKGWRFA